MRVNLRAGATTGDEGRRGDSVQIRANGLIAGSSVDYDLSIRNRGSGLGIHDADTLDLARIPMQLVGATMIFEALGLVLMQALLGAGDATRVMLVAITMQWVVFLPLAYVAGPVFGLGLLGIWVLQGLYRLFQSLIFVGFWRGRRWATVKV